MRDEWTDNRRKVAAFLEKYFRENGRAPSMDEISRGTGLWKRSVEIVLKGLAKIGFIEITPGISRGIKLLRDDYLRVPLLGEVQAGAPALAQEEAVAFVKVRRDIVNFSDPVALRVEGYSMKDAGILPGDIVLLRQQQNAQNGETVVAWFNGGLTVKKLERSGKAVRLHPANPSFSVMDVNAADEFYIIGRVMLVVRDLGDCFDFGFEDGD